MQPQSITVVTKKFNISTRTLRYYEQIGLLASTRVPGYAYRAYDEAAQTRLAQILLLRRLRIPLKQIGEVLQGRDAALALEVFQSELAGIDAEMATLSAIRGVLEALAGRLASSLGRPLELGHLADDEMLRVVETLAPPKKTFKEEPGMQNEPAAPRPLRDVRIVYLPPTPVAALHLPGENREQDAEAQMDAFIQSANLAQYKPDFRKFGFNNPAVESGPSAGYELWVTIPETLDVPAPFQKKQFLGGQYAAHMIPFGAFHEWAYLAEWLQTSAEYDMDFETVRVQPPPADFPDPAMEEVLNAIHHIGGANAENIQLDLLFPVRPKAATPKPEGQ